MNRSLATALALGLAFTAGVTVVHPAFAQAPPAVDCNAFATLRDEAQKKASAIQAAGKSHADRQEMCNLVTRFSAAEALVVKFLQDNKTWCGVPDQALTQSKTNHESTLKFRTMVCAEGPAKAKPPTLSDAISTPLVDSSQNTKTGAGTFDTLTGNPLAK